MYILDIDVLPQLYNVIKGDMSFVGPRPEVPEFIKFLTPEQMKIFSLRPGITSPASIKFSNEEELLPENPEQRQSFYVKIILPEKLKIDQDYIINRNFRMDLKIIFQTFCHMFKKK